MQPINDQNKRLFYLLKLPGITVRFIAEHPCILHSRTDFIDGVSSAFRPLVIGGDPGRV